MRGSANFYDVETLSLPTTFPRRARRSCSQCRQPPPPPSAGGACRRRVSGLARMEFVINKLDQGSIRSPLPASTSWRMTGARKTIEELTRSGLRRTRATIFVDRLAQGLAKIAGDLLLQKPTIVRMSDLQDQRVCRPDRRRPVRGRKEENPMLGFRGAVALLFRSLSRRFCASNAAPSASCARRSASTTVSG